MSILITKKTKVITQGFTGKNGTFHSEQAIAYGTKMVGGTSPGRAGPCISACRCSTRSARPARRRGPTPPSSTCPRRARLTPSARRSTRRSRSSSASPRASRAARHGAGQALARGLQVAAHRAELPGRRHRGQCKIGIMPANIFKKGNVGIVSRSGTLTYEAVFQTTREGLGQTTAVGIGGDPVKDRVHRHARDVPGRRQDRVDHHDRRDRRLGRGGRGAVHPRRGERGRKKREADCRLHRRPHRPSRRRMAMPAPSFRAARAEPRTRSRRWSGPASRCRPRPRASARRWWMF